VQKPQRILLVADSSSQEIADFISAVTRSLTDAGVQTRTWSPGTGLDSKIYEDLIIVMGGDGSLMSLLRDLGHPIVPIYGVNFGRVGFLMNPLQEASELVDTVLGGDFIEQRLPVIQARWTSSDGESHSASGINDIVLERDSGQTVHLEVFIDEVFLNAYSGDGLVISTPAGSTAYSLAAGGPVVHPGVSGIVVTPLNAHRPVQFHSLQFPVVLPLETAIRVERKGGVKRPIRVVVDGESFSEVQQLVVEDRGDYVRLLRPSGHQYIQSLLTRIIGEAPSTD